MTDQELKQLQTTELKILMDFHGYCQTHGLQYYLIGGALLGCARYGGFIPWDDDIDVGMPREDYERLKSLWQQDGIPGYFLQHETSDPLFSRAIMKVRMNHTHIIEKSSMNVPINDGIYIDIFPIDYLSDYSPAVIDLRARRIHRLMSLRTMKCGYMNNRFRLIKKIMKWLLMPVPVKLLDKQIKKLSTMDNDADRKYMILFTHNYVWRKQVHPLSTFGKGTERQFCGHYVICPDDTDRFLRTVFGDQYMEEPVEEKRKIHTHI